MEFAQLLLALGLNGCEIDGFCSLGFVHIGYRIPFVGWFHDFRLLLGASSVRPLDLLRLSDR